MELCNEQDTVKLPLGVSKSGILDLQKLL